MLQYRSQQQQKQCRQRSISSTDIASPFHVSARSLFFGNNHNENVENVEHTVYVRLRIRNVIIRIAVQHSDVMSRHLPQQMLQAPELGIYKSTRTVKTYHQGQSGSNPESGSGTLPEFDTDFLVH